MKSPRTHPRKPSLSRADRKRAIRKAVSERRKRDGSPSSALPPEAAPCTEPISTGSRVSFFDTRGRYVVGTVLDEDSFRVTKSNYIPPWTVVFKHPYLSWEECVHPVGGSTLIRPKELLGFTRLMTDDLDTLEPEGNYDDPDRSGPDAFLRGA